MDRSNLLIGAGVLLGLGSLAYWLMNRESGTAGSGTAASQPMTAADKARAYAAALKNRNFKIVAPSNIYTRAAVVANRGTPDFMESDF
jgi:hypothetical protein